jgi:hypothetical protein
VREAFRAVTRAAVPGAGELDEAAWVRGEALVEGALADRPPRVRRQVALFLRILGALSWLRFGRSLTRLDASGAQGLLASVERSPLLLLRRGMWGVRTLAFMGVYGQTQVRRSLGYAAAAGGWGARAGTQGPWPERAGAAPPEPGSLLAPSPDDAHG